MARNLTDRQVVSILKKYGWIAKGDKPSGKALTGAVKDFQAFWNLEPDGIVGPYTTRMLTAERFCGCPDRVEAATAKWGFLDVSYSTHSWGLRQFTSDETDEHYDTAMELWNAVCGIRLHRIASGGNIYTSDSAEGAGGTLAWSYLPGANSGPSERVQQWYDRAENWSRQFFIAVAAHEIGHALGLGHDSSQSALMYPYANSNIWKPQERDIARVVDRYGQPQPKPPEPPEPPDKPPSPPVGTFQGILMNVDGPGKHRPIELTIGQEVSI